VLFVASGELPAEIARDNVFNALQGTTYRHYVGVLDKAYHNAVCIAYSINEFPTLLVLDDHAEVVYRETRTSKMHEEKLLAILQVIHYHRTHE
jgi:hypothetical protein